MPDKIEQIRNQEINAVDEARKKLQNSMNSLLKKIGKVQIGPKDLFPYGWRKAAKGRTVWRILEELITQNLEKYHKEFGIEKVEPAESEVGVFDLKFCLAEGDPIYVNVKSAVVGGRTNKDDISKANGLRDFFEEDTSRCLMVVTILIEFKEDMTISLNESIAFPITWIPDIYVNPSNNGNLQSSKYKSIDGATKRTNAEFLTELKKKIAVANQKRLKKQKKA